VSSASLGFGELLAKPNVREVSELRSPLLGFMAYHGGQLEKVTDVIASTAAEAAGCSYYGVLQSDEDNVVHLPSKTGSQRSWITSMLSSPCMAMAANGCGTLFCSVAETES